MYRKIIILGFICLISCESETVDQLKAVKTQVKNSSSVLGNLSNIEENAKNTEKQMEELKKLTPFSNDDFKAWMPEEIAGMKRVDYSFQSMMGSQGKLKFADESGDNTFEINIIDGAGETGAAIVTSQNMLTGIYGNFETENETKREQITERNGVKALETYYKNDHRSEVKTMVNDRFMVQAKADNRTPEEVHELIQDLNIHQLQ